MDLSIVVNGMTLPNPFLLGSGPPGTNARVIAKSYDAGWGGAVAKTISLEIGEGRKRGAALWQTAFKDFRRSDRL